MKAQDVIIGSRALHVRELQRKCESLARENARLRTENEELTRHLDLAVLAAADLARLGEHGKLIIVDGWNAILASSRIARSREELCAEMRQHLARNPDDLVWIVFDGSRAASVCEGRLRISYTGGTGLHRADRTICDYVRMAGFRGDRSRIEVRTADRDFLRELSRLQQSDRSENDLTERR